jgi:CheY-like chemotaxis protein
MNILLVDDDVFFQNLISFDLLQDGHTITIAEDGKKAIDLLNKNPNVDVILCDVYMPVLTGPSFILSLKQIYKKKLPKIIIVSAANEGAAFMKKIEIPHDYYLEKPIHKADLDKILHSISNKG